jgi:hypothetical protein
VGGSDGGDLLVVCVDGCVVEPAVEEDEVVVVVLPARVMDMGADLVAGDDGANTTAGAALSGRDGDGAFGASRCDRDGGGESQSESSEVLHDGDGCW